MKILKSGGDSPPKSYWRSPDPANRPGTRETHEAARPHSDAGSVCANPEGMIAKLVCDELLNILSYWQARIPRQVSAMHSEPTACLGNREFAHGDLGGS